jgi:hypothetical protein
MTDVPTLTSATVANYAVLNPLATPSGTITNGNLRSSTSSGNSDVGSMAMQSGKWYWEVTLTTSSNPRVGMYDIGKALPTAVGLGGTNSWAIINGPSRLYYQGTIVAYGSFVGNSGSVVMIAYDPTNGNLWFGENGSWFASGNPATGASPSLTGVTGTAIVPATASGSGANVFDYNFGQQPFTYTPPSGFVALNTYNLPTPTILAGNKYMDATLWTGTGANLTITNTGAFQPDFLWIKSRTTAQSHNLVDSVRGSHQVLFSDLTGAEQTSTSTSGVLSFNSNGFLLGTDTSTTGQTNSTGQSFVGWQWQAGKGTTSSNTNGSITSTVSVNASAGFSVVTYTGTGANATVGHGLGVAPSFIIVKNRSSALAWPVYTSYYGKDAVLQLESTTAGIGAAGYWGAANPTSSVFGVGTSLNNNGSGNALVAYCWTPIAGFSAFGSYTGNGSATGPFVYCGFQPKFVMMKSTSTGGWVMIDTSRNPYNITQAYLYAQSSGAEATGSNVINIYSNGFSPQTTWTDINPSGTSVIYAAFASNPFRNSLAF